jgi:YD repeat-containing protein
MFFVQEGFTYFPDGYDCGGRRASRKNSRDLGSVTATNGKIKVKWDGAGRAVSVTASAAICYIKLKPTATKR